MAKSLFIGLYFCSTLVSPIALATPIDPAFKAAYKAWERAYNQGITKKTIFVYVDFTKPSNQTRFYVYDAHARKFLITTYSSHGIGSGKGLYAKTFSNVPGSKATSLGVQITKHFYTGKHGLNLRIHGLEKWNSNAYPRYIEIHGASYIGNGKTGTSWGCYAVPNSRIKEVLRVVGEGTIVVAYANNSDWLNNSKFLKG